MRYALDCAVMALGAMEKSVSDDKKCHPLMALSFLKQLRLHLEAINNVPRKVLLFVYCCIMTFSSLVLVVFDLLLHCLYIDY